MKCLDSLNWTLWVRYHGWYWYQPLIDGSNIWVCGKDRPLGSRNGPSAIGPQQFVRNAVVWYVNCLVSFNWTLWVRFHGWYWFQSFMDGSNIWGVGRTDPLGPEMDNPPSGRSYLVVVLSYDMSGALILLTGLYGWYSIRGIDTNPSSMGPIFGVWMGPTLGVSKWNIRHWAAAIW